MNTDFFKMPFSYLKLWGEKYTQYHILIRIGIYGLLSILFIYFASEWLFNYSVSQVFTPNLPPSWYELGSVNHFLGTDSSGHDIFYQLLTSYKMTLLITIRTTLYMLFASIMINYISYKSRIIRFILSLFSKVFMLIPPLLTVMVVSLVFNHRLTLILLVIGLAYLPTFVNNIQDSLDDEWDKPYVLADQLDGMSRYTLFFRVVLPNLFSNYLIQLVRLFSQIMLAIVIITFFKFGSGFREPDLGELMREMLSIYTVNPWGVLSAGLLIMLTVVFMNLITLGIQRS